MPAVSKDQIALAIKAGLQEDSVRFLAEVCTDYALPFWLGCTIMSKETNGRNVYGHDLGGSLSGFELPVTEENYRVYEWMIARGGKNNGVGVMQLTWRGYFTNLSKTGMLDLGYRPWDPHDNIRYAVKYGLGPMWKKQTTIKPFVLSKAVWSVAKLYNGKDSYADDAVTKSVTWIARVGNVDQPLWH